MFKGAFGGGSRLIVGNWLATCLPSRQTKTRIPMKTPMIPSNSNLLCLALAMLLNATVIDISQAGENTGEKREMLSRHQTVAQFAGTAYHKCLGMTSLCPDKCGSSGDMATFQILKYLSYEKPGKYGDEQQKRYQFLVQDNMKNLKVPAGVKATIDSLNAGDYVLLDWQHDYVTKGGSKFPERNVLQLKRISREEADKLTGGLDKLPKEEPVTKPAAVRNVPKAR